MYLRIIACEVLAREVYLAAATSPHMVDVELVAMGLHETPDVLRAELQQRIDVADGQDYEAIVLAYGLCGNSTLGLAARNKPVVLVRAHDCITLYLGSRSRYQEEFLGHPGTYYYSDDYVERSGRTSSASFSSLGASTDANVQETYEEYAEKYGADNAAYLMEVMGAWKEHYKRAAYIDMGIMPGQSCRVRALDEAERRGWEFADLRGDPSLIRRLVHGEWDSDFLLLQPGQRVAVTYGDDVIGAAHSAEKGHS